MAATSGWTSNSTPGTIGNDQATNNSSGFAALPGGVRIKSGVSQSLNIPVHSGAPLNTPLAMAMQ